MSYQITRTVIDDSSWTPILAPYNTNFLALYSEPDASFPSGVALLIRTNPADAGTEKTIPAGVQETVTVLSVSGKNRFLSGVAACWIKQSTGTPATTSTVVSTWT